MRPPKNTSYNASATFRTRSRDKGNSAPGSTQARGMPPHVPERAGHSLNIENSQEGAWRRANSLFHEIGNTNATGFDTIPLRSATEFYPSTALGSMYRGGGLDFNIAPGKPISPESQLGFAKRPRENLNDYDKSRPSLHMDTYNRVGYDHLNGHGMASVFGAGNMDIEGTHRMRIETPGPGGPDGMGKLVRA